MTGARVQWAAAALAFLFILAALLLPVVATVQAGTAAGVALAVVLALFVVVVAGGVGLAMLRVAPDLAERQQEAFRQAFDVDDDDTTGGNHGT